MLNVEKKSTKALVMSGLPHGSSIPSDLSGYMAKINSLTDKLLKKRSSALTAMIELTSMIDKLEDLNEKDILTKVYVYGYDLIELTGKGKSYRTLQSIYAGALENMKIIMIENGKWQKKKCTEWVMR